MALGRSSIQETRSNLREIKLKQAAIKSSNESFRKLFNDSNFQKFVDETNRGAVIKKQFTDLSSWMDKLPGDVYHRIVVSNRLF